MRKQIEERAYFTYEQKEQILAKSDSKCCHCGRKLTLTDKNYKKITVEHIIPISKGGTNEDKNLVALCEECNKAKGNQVIMPEDYLLYLNKEHLEVAKAMYADYCADVSWFSTHCYTREDAYPIDYQMPMPNLGGKTPKAKEKCGYYVSGMSHRAILKRCTADDLDALCDYVYKYNRKFNVTATLTPEQVREVVTDEFNRGCIYKLHKNGEIMALFPMAIERHKYIFEDIQLFS